MNCVYYLEIYNIQSIILMGTNILHIIENSLPENKIN